MSNHKRKFPPVSVNQNKRSKLGPLRLPSVLFSSKKTRESVEVMACESHECHDSDPFSSTPLQASSSASPSPQRNPKEHDQCFMCKGLGHWSKDCPSKTPPKSLASSPGSSSSPSVQVPDLPVVRCPCGRGTCKVSTSKTVTNPGRKFYACPVDHRTSDRCRFFKWSDEIVPRFKPRMCPCGAGSCSLNIISTGPDRGRWYFACRIKKVCSLTFASFSFSTIF
ncbi:hypothetical protein NC651_022689 [Populus alba x Populus x berolinensis]|nr:hypothetical protein NC651_022689 [Populus alba x Populus x berolinensis]